MTAEELKQTLVYDPETGVFQWKALPHKCASNIRVGDVAGWIENTGYRRITVGAQRYVAHRLAWLYVYGEMPNGKLDHKDGNPDNNAIRNLRIASPRQNGANRKCGKNNFIGLKGVQLHETGRYRARIFLNGKHKSLGLYDTAEEAHKAYEVAATVAFGEYARAK